MLSTRLTVISRATVQTSPRPNNIMRLLSRVLLAALAAFAIPQTIQAQNPSQVGCNPASWLQGVPRIGTTFTVCMSANAGCHGCVLISLFPGPTQVGSISAPIGLPVGLAATVVFTSQNVCFPIALPPVPGWDGLTFYMTVATLDSANTLEFSPQQKIVITT